MKKKSFPSRQSNPDYSVVQHADKSLYRSNDPNSYYASICSRGQYYEWCRRYVSLNVKQPSSTLSISQFYLRSSVFIILPLLLLLLCGCSESSTMKEPPPDVGVNMLLWEEAKKKFPLVCAGVPTMQHGDFAAIQFHKIFQRSCSSRTLLIFRNLTAIRGFRLLAWA